MSFADLMPAIQSLPIEEKVQLYRFLTEELESERRDLEPLPEGFPPPGDGCPSTREELDWMRRQPGIYSLDEILRSLGQP